MSRKHRQRGYTYDTGTKEGVPLLGGVLIFSGSLLAILSWCDLSDRYVHAAIAASVWFFFTGLIDDLGKVRAGNSDGGMSRKVKYLVQFGFGAVLGLWLMGPGSPHPEYLRDALSLPFYKELYHLGWLQVPFVALVIALVANSVNFADGMDGLATVPSFMTFLGLAIFSYICGHVIWSNHFLFFVLPQGGSGLPCSELVVVSFALMGGLIGFLWYNAFPAQMFMGDCGSMFLGGLMGTVFVLIKQEYLFPVFGIVFVLELGSVILQDWLGIKLLGRRILYRAPFHDNLKYRGWSEPKIVVRMWILSSMALAAGLLTIKLR
ncbi:MAG: phospho-N-acetylmuramoyl-pentapeptide-transferase [Planctomycetes bacterium]|nr:phospho-N-acetylmuramoyl-pentapeptide-transferase [Planctomycetota bacterium]